MPKAVNAEAWREIREKRKKKSKKEQPNCFRILNVFRLFLFSNTDNQHINSSLFPFSKQSVHVHTWQYGSNIKTWNRLGEHIGSDSYAESRFCVHGFRTPLDTANEMAKCGYVCRVWWFQFVDKCSHTKTMATCEELIIQGRWRAATQETDLRDFLSEELRGHW